MNQIEFKPPQGFTVPEGIQPGQDFDVVSSFRLRPNGALCLVQLGDVKLPGYAAKDDEKPKYGDYAKMVGPMPTEGES